MDLLRTGLHSDIIRKLANPVVAADVLGTLAIAGSAAVATDIARLALGKTFSTLGVRDQKLLRTTKDLQPPFRGERAQQLHLRTHWVIGYFDGFRLQLRVVTTSTSSSTPASSGRARLFASAAVNPVAGSMAPSMEILSKWHTRWLHLPHTQFCCRPWMSLWPLPTVMAKNGTGAFCWRMAEPTTTLE